MSHTLYRVPEHSLVATIHPGQHRKQYTPTSAISRCGAALLPRTSPVRPSMQRHPPDSATRPSGCSPSQQAWVLWSSAGCCNLPHVPWSRTVGHANCNLDARTMIHGLIAYFIMYTLMFNTPAPCTMYVNSFHTRNGPFPRFAFVFLCEIERRIPCARIT